MKARRSTELVEKKDFYKELFSLAIPIGMQNLLVALIGASDALMLGRLTQDAVSAVSLANQIAFIMSLFSGAVVGGGGALIAQYWGKGDWTMVKNLFCMLIKWAFGISFVFFALAMFAPELLMRIYTPDTALIKIGASYLRAVSLSYLFTGVTQCYYLIMKLEGKAPKSVLISVVTLITDVVLDFFLIYGFAGVPKLGANGSAYSTVVVELVALIWWVSMVFHRYNQRSVQNRASHAGQFSCVGIRIFHALTDHGTPGIRCHCSCIHRVRSTRAYNLCLQGYFCGRGNYGR